MTSKSAIGTASAVLHYLYPPLVAVYFLSASAYYFVTLRKAKERKRRSRQGILASCLQIALVTSYVTDGVLCVTRTTRGKGWYPNDDYSFYLMASLLVWGFLSLTLSDTLSPVWGSYLGIWSIGLVCETILLTLSLLLEDTFKWLGFTRLAVSFVRFLILVVLFTNGFSLVSKQSMEKVQTDEESRSLLNSNGSANTTKNGVDYGTVPKKSSSANSDTSESGDDSEVDEEDDDRNKEIKEQQKKRLEEQGGWVGYVKGFALFLPYLWPSGNRKIQLCLVGIGLKLGIDRVLNILEPMSYGLLVNGLTRARGTELMPWREVAFYLGISWLRSSSGFDLVEQWLRIRYQNFSYQQITTLAFRHVMNLSMDFHHDKDLGEITAAMNQGEAINDLLDVLLYDVGPIAIDMVVALVYVSHLIDMYTAGVIFFAGIAYVWLGVRLTSWTAPRRRVYVAKSRKERKTMMQAISGWETVTYFNRTHYEEDRFEKSVEDAIASQIKYYDRSYVSYAVQDLILTLGFSGMAVLGVYRVVQGSKDVGSFVTLIGLWSLMSSPLSSVVYRYKTLANNFIDAERMLQLLQTKPTVTNKDKAVKLQVGGGQVEFNHVNFAYDQRKPILKDVDFVAEPGQTIAFVGETGGGKSTTLKLLFRFYDVTGGSVKIDGQDIRDVTMESLRDALGVVPQDSALFNQSIVDNVRYAHLNATQEEVEEACKAAAIHDKIMTFPDGYKSKVGERGVKLSGGELQRVSIARVLLKNPKIVLLDEATSAVDSSTEAQIQEAFKKLSQGRTTFVIAHRLSTIMDADLILVVDNGEIIERGTHFELLGKHGKYSQLWAKQSAKKSSQASSVTAKNSSDELVNDVPAKTYSEELAANLSGSTEEDIQAQFDGAKESKIKGTSSGIAKRIKQLTSGKEGAEADEEDVESLPEIQALSPRPTDGQADASSSGSKGKEVKRD